MAEIANQDVTYKLIEAAMRVHYEIGLAVKKVPCLRALRKSRGNRHLWLSDASKATEAPRLIRSLPVDYQGAAA
jgi:hypothetical protein